MYSFVSVWLLVNILWVPPMLFLMAVTKSFLFCTLFNYMTMPQFIIHLAIHGHVVCFLALMNVLYMSFGARMLDIYLVVELLSHRYLPVCSVLIDIIKQFSKVFIPIYTPINDGWDFHLLLYLPTLRIVILL